MARSAKLITFADLYFSLVAALVQTVRLCRSQRLTWLLVEAITFLAYHLSRRKRRASEALLLKVFGRDLDPPRLGQIVRSSFRQFWLDIFLIPGTATWQKQARPAAIEGLEPLRRALESGKGAILWETSYFGRRLLPKCILNREGFAITQVHARYHTGGFGRGTATRFRRRFLQPFFENCEKPYVKQIVYLDGPESLAFSKGLAELLKSNEILCISAEGRQGRKFVPVPFLGQTVNFPTGVLSLAKLTGAPIFPLLCVAEKGHQIRVIIEQPIRIDRSEERERGLRTAATRYVSLLESYVKSYPEQYRNWHGLARLQQSTGHEHGGAPSRPQP